MWKLAAWSVLASAAAAHAGPDEIIASVAPGALRQIVYVSRGDSVLALTSSTSAAVLALAMAPFASRESRLVAVQLTATIGDASSSTVFLIRALREGGVAVACTIPTQARIAPRACGNGSHRDVALAYDTSDDDRRRGLARIVVTTRSFADFSEPDGTACRANTPIAFEPTVTRYEIPLDGTCTLLP